MENNDVIGGCSKHPGNSFIDCPECEIERMTNEFKRIKVIICPDGVMAKTLNPCMKPSTIVYKKDIILYNRMYESWQKAEDERKVYWIEVPIPMVLVDYAPGYDFKHKPGTEHWAILVDETTCKIL